MSSWDKYSRVGLEAATAATSIGFSAAKTGTKLGFSVARTVATSAAGLAGSAVDHAVFRGSIGAGPAFGGAVSTAISAVETLTLTPILIGESLVSTTLVAAQSSLSVLRAIFPGSDEASFSLTNFVALVRREWSEDMNDAASPANKYSFAEIMKALVAWAAVQGVTSDWQEKRWFNYLKEIPVNDGPYNHDPPLSVSSRASRIQVTKDVLYPSQGGQILAADIGEVSSSAALPPARAFHQDTNTCNSNAELKATLRRFSKLVLAGYGGASLLFFGVPLTPAAAALAAEKIDEEAKLAAAVGSSEEEALGPSCPPAPIDPSVSQSSSYSWWDVLRGKHDKEILLQYARSNAPTATEDSPGHLGIDTIQGGDASLMPRFWILTDHTRREVVLVIRGTMSLNELAVDLTCDPAEFRLHTSGSPLDASSLNEQEELDAFDEQLESIPGSFPLDLSTPPSPAASIRRHRHSRQPSESSISSEVGDTYLVHGGMLKMAQAMGNRGKPVHAAIKHALKQHDGYDLVICGHSLGAGVAGLLALMWADPHTCLTNRNSGLPTKRKVAAYCYAPPCLVSARLSRLAASSNLITSFVYSHDVVSRLSLGSMRDLRRASAWLCEAEKEGRGDGYGGITARALKSKTWFGKPDDAQWFIAIRKTLEANMHMANLYPPGRVLWAMREGDMDPSQRVAQNTEKGTDKLRLFEVQNVEEVFGQIVFAKDMLSSHGPHQYDRVLHELL